MGGSDSSRSETSRLIPRRRKRERPSYLEDAVLTAAAKAGTARLLERVKKLKAEDLKMNVRELVATETALVRKAKAWIINKSIHRQKVKINQLASVLKIKTDEAKEIACQVASSYTDKDELGRTFAIFVENNQAPDWLRKVVSNTGILSMLSAARYTFMDSIERQCHIKYLTLKYGETLEQTIRNAYTCNQQIVLNSLALAGIDQYVGELDELPEIGFIGTVFHGRYVSGGNRQVIRDLEQGSTVTMSFGSIMLSDGYDTNNPRTIEYRFSRQPELNPDPEVIVERTQKVQRLVNALHVYGLHLYGAEPAFRIDPKTTRCSLTFVTTNDISDSVRIVLPWDYTVFKIKA